MDVSNFIRRLRRREVEAIVGVSTTKLYKMMAEGRFPRPLKDGYLSYWPSNVVEDWVRADIERATREQAA